MRIDLKKSDHINHLKPLKGLDLTKKYTPKVSEFADLTAHLKPLERLDSTKKHTAKVSELSDFVSLIAQLSEPARRSNRLQQDYMEGKPVNIDEIKIAQAEESILTSAVIKTTEKLVHFIESTSNMQI